MCGKSCKGEKKGQRRVWDRPVRCKELRIFVEEETSDMDYTYQRTFSRAQT